MVLAKQSVHHQKVQQCGVAHQYHPKATFLQLNFATCKPCRKFTKKKTFFVTPLHPDLVSASPPGAKLGRKNEIHEKHSLKVHKSIQFWNAFKNLVKKWLVKKCPVSAKLPKLPPKVPMSCLENHHLKVDV